MWNTRFMSRLFSATEEGDEELTEQVANEIEGARKNGSVDTDEVHYEDEGDGKVSITDKENGEVTIAERAEDGNYDLYPAQVTENLAGYLHPEMDGVTPGQQIDPNAGEDAFEHIQNGMISPNVPGYGLNPQAGFEPSVEGLAECGPEGCDDEREFSVSTDNTAVLKIFSSQAYWEKTFSEVIESEETAKVGDIKVEKDPNEENTVICRYDNVLCNCHLRTTKRKSQRDHGQDCSQRETIGWHQRSLLRNTERNHPTER